MNTEVNPRQLKMAKELCKTLTEYEPDESYCIGIFCGIKHKSNDGRALIINDQDPKRYIASCHYDADYKPEKVLTQIGGGKKRGIPSLAESISKRLLPVYDVQYPKSLELKEESERCQKSQRAVRDRMLDILETKASDFHTDSLQVLPYKHGVNEVTVSTDRVKIETAYIPEEVAAKVLKLLKKELPA